MFSPGGTATLLDEISAVAASAQLVEKLGGWIDPETVFTELFADHEYAAWLDAGPESDSGWSYLAVVGAAGYVLSGDPDSCSVEVRESQQLPRLDPRRAGSQRFGERCR